jgi:hypothetical protein
MPSVRGEFADLGQVEEWVGRVVALSHMTSSMELPLGEGER